MRCFLDIDGVLADFDKAMSHAHGGYTWNQEEQQPWDTESWLGMTAEQWWEPANSVEFWQHLEWTEDGKDILKEAEWYFTKEHICLLTSPSLSPHSTVGKILWIREHLPEYARQFLIGGCKHFCASPNTVLIDDHDKNIEMFERHGGIGILVPRRWNSLWQKRDATFSVVRHELSML